MSAFPNLTVNLGDPDDVLAKLPEARRVAKGLRKEAEQLVAQAEAWDRLVNVLEGIAPHTDVAADETADGDASSIDVVVGILEATGGPITVAGVHEITRGQFTRKTTGWALWKAVQLHRARQEGRGIYAPLSYQPEEIFPESHLE